MLHIRLDSENLRKIAEDAIKRGEYGIVIWHTQARWCNLRESFSPHDELFNELAKEIQSGKAMWFNIERHSSEELKIKTRKDLDYTAIEWVGIAEAIASAKRIVEDEEYCNWLSRICQFYPLMGPVTVFPSMHLSSAHFNPVIAKSES